MKVSASTQQLFEMAKKSREHSHSPYSHHKVGAALRTSDGKTYAGCNVENSSFGGTICAERTAIFSAVAAQGKFKIDEIVVVTDANPPWPPCGFCRQVIAEFATDCVVKSMNLQGEVIEMNFKDLFPAAFTPSHLDT